MEVTDKEPLVRHTRKNECGGFSKGLLITIIGVFVLLLIIIIILSVQGSNQEWPFTKSEEGESMRYKDSFKAMWAPFTPTLNDYSPGSVPTMNYSAIPYLAATGNKFGANIIFLGGSNAQFDTMTVEERKELLDTWVQVTIENNYDFYIIFQLCSTRLWESVELAAYAKQVHEQYGKPDAIGSLPPFYERPSTTDGFEQMMTWFRPVVDAAEGLPFWYYHLPGQTLVDFSMRDFVNAAYNGNSLGTNLTELKGTKYVASDGRDIFDTTRLYSDDGDGSIGMYGGFDFIIWNSPTMSFTSYDKAAGFGQDYYWIPLRKCILKAIENGRYDEAYDYQQWRYEWSSKLGGNTNKRCLHQRISGFDMGPPRQPDVPNDPDFCEGYLDEMEEDGFFDDLENMINDCV